MTNQKSFKESIQESIDKGGKLKSEAISYLLTIQSVDSMGEFQDVIQTMVEISDFQEYYNDRILSLIENTYNESDVEKEKVRSFLFEYLKTGIPFGKKYTFYYMIYQQFKFDQSYLFPITENELKQICFERLETYVKDRLNGLDDCQNLYYLCREMVDEQDHVVLQERAHPLMREYIQRNQWEYIQSLIRPYGIPIYPRYSGWAIEPFVEYTFNGWVRFWEFLDSYRNTSKYKATKQEFEKYYLFFEAFRDYNYKPFKIPKNDWGKYGIHELIDRNHWSVADY